MPEQTEGELAIAGAFPKELVSFFQSGGPKLLLVKGKMRTGKTLFVLGLAETVGPTKNCFLVSTKPPEPGQNETFPWIKVNETRDKAVAADAPIPTPAPRIIAPEKPKKAEETAKVKSAKDLLKSILGDVPTAPTPAPEPSEPAAAQPAAPAGPDLTNLKKTFGAKEPKELISVYKGVMALAPAATFVVINRADRLGERYGVTLPALAQLLKEDLVVARNAHVVLVLEKPETGADTMADGIVTLKEFSEGADYLGTLELNKLAGINIKQPKSMYNLNGGKFQVLKGMKVWG